MRRLGIHKKGQSTIEFTFVLVMIFFLAYGLVRVFHWTGMDLAERRWAHEHMMTTGQTPEQQLTPDFYRAKRINAFHRNAQVE